MSQRRAGLSAALLATLVFLASCEDGGPGLGERPVANDVAASTTNVRAVEIALTGSHPQGAALSFTIAVGPSHGTLGPVIPRTAASAVVAYTPDPDFTGRDAFEYVVSDGALTSAPGTVVVTVTANSAPSASDRLALTLEGRGVTVTLAGSDRDGDSLTFVVVAGPAHGTIGAARSVTDTTARIIYTPQAGFVGSDAFSFAASDGAVAGPPARVRITVRSADTGRIAADGANTCALDGAGQAFCWGAGDQGQLGDGTTVKFWSAPVAVSGAPSFRQVEVGTAHACGLTDAGVAFCWGDNDRGQLGDGTFADFRATPAPVVGGHTFVQLVADGSHTCGLDDTGRAFCWGDNSVGQVGDGTTRDRYAEPVPVAGGHTFVLLAAGDHHVCGLDDTGQAFCWGLNDAGQLGDGTRVLRRSPAPVVGGRRFVELAADYYHTCALDETGAAFCWGSNASALGDGSRVIRTAPFEVTGGARFVLLVAGGDHTCGLDDAGQALCWGVNDDGELGDGTTTGDDCGGFPPCRMTPAPVTGGRTFVWLAAGQDHNCALDAAGRAFCWGRNALGQLGDGTTTGRTVPTRVAGPF